MSEYHVVPRFNGKWVFIKKGNSRPTRIFTNNKDAIDYSKEKVKISDIIYIHRSNGSVMYGIKCTLKSQRTTEWKVI